VTESQADSTVIILTVLHIRKIFDVGLTVLKKKPEADEEGKFCMAWRVAATRL
jgi:hypothetical protein